MPKFSRSPVLFANNENNHDTLYQRQPHADIGIPQDMSFLPTGSTLAMQCEDWGPWMLGTVVGHI